MARIALAFPGPARSSGVMRGARGRSSRRSAVGSGECSDSASAGFTGPRGRPLEGLRGSPTVENTRFLWPMPPAVPSRVIDRLHHVVEVVRGLAQHVNTTFLTTRFGRGRAPATISALPTTGAAEALAARHAEHAADRAAPPGSTRTGQRRAATARSPRSGRRPAPPTPTRSRPRPDGRSAAGPVRPAPTRARAARRAARQQPLRISDAALARILGLRVDPWRSTRASWSGETPSAQALARRSEMRMVRAKEEVPVRGGVTAPCTSFVAGAPHQAGATRLPSTGG